MNTRLNLQASLALLAAATLVACSSVPERNMALDEARSRHATLQATPQVGEHAAQELARATASLRAAEAAHAAREEHTTVNHLAYLARQQVAIAQATATSRAAQAVTSGAAAERDRLRLAVRTAEADQAQRALQTAQQEAQQTAVRTEAERAQAERSAEEAARKAQADQSRLSASKSQVDRLQEQLRELDTLKARNTERGIVVTLGDLLFDTGRAQLQPGGTRSVAQLGQFLLKHPEQRVMIEGHTDSVGSRASNQALSDRRAQSVRSALIVMGVSPGRLSTVGHGQAMPVASNDTASGRQMNRRVEVVFTAVADVATRP